MGARSSATAADTGATHPFVYADTASTRAGIQAVSDTLSGGAVAIVGLGGTGSYVLDLVAKTPVSRIVLVDGDGLEPHNAFRAPGPCRSPRSRPG